MSEKSGWVELPSGGAVKFEGGIPVRISTGESNEDEVPDTGEVDTLLNEASVVAGRELAYEGEWSAAEGEGEAVRSVRVVPLVPGVAKFRREELNPGPGDEAQILTICRLDGSRLCSADLGRSTPFVVQITDEDGTFVGIYNLDGEQINSSCEWHVATEIPTDVIESVEQGWESGTTTVTRL